MSLQGTHLTVAHMTMGPVAVEGVKRRKGRRRGEKMEGRRRVGPPATLMEMVKGSRGHPSASDGGEKAPKPKTTEQQVRC